MLLAAPSTHAETGQFDEHTIARVSALKSDLRPRKIVPELRINASATYRLVVPNKCERRGEAELRALAETALVEESYLFIPSLCLWIETGYNETFDSVRLDQAFVESVIRDYPAIVLYHIHVGQPDEVSRYFPAYADLVSLVLLNVQFLTDPSIKIGHRAMTTRGTIDYAFVVSDKSRRLLDKLKRTGLATFVAQNMAYEFNRAGHKQPYYKAVETCRGVTRGRPERLADCFPIKTEDFTLQFRPANDDLPPRRSFRSSAFNRADARPASRP